MITQLHSPLLAKKKATMKSRHGNVISRLFCSAVLFTVTMMWFATVGYGQVQSPPLNRFPMFSVKLTATPNAVAYPYISSYATLVTTVYSKDSNSIAGAPAELVSDSRLRYTYTTQRTWPCVGPATALGSATEQRSVDRNLPPGEYTATVRVTSVDPVPRPPGYVPLPPLIGEASAAKFTLWSHFGTDLQVSTYPPTGSHAPVTLRATLFFAPAASGMRYVFRMYSAPVGGGGQLIGTQDSVQGSYTFTKTIAAPGTQSYFYRADKIRQSDCAWLSYQDNSYVYKVAP